MKKVKNKGLIVEYDNTREVIEKGDSWVFANSLKLADVLQTEHYEVLKRIRKVLKDYDLEVKDFNSVTSETEEFIYKNTDFTYSICNYKDSQGKLRPYYKLSKDLLILVIFSFRKLKNAQQLQKIYIAKFNQMEKELAWYKARYMGIATRNFMTDNIRDYYDISQSKENPYVAFTNLVYLTLYGFKTYQLRIQKGLKKGENLRPWLTDEEAKVVDKMEQEVGILISYGMTLGEIRNKIKIKYKDKSKRKFAILEEKRK